jgi:DNA-binding response OmpR family regulator
MRVLILEIDEGEAGAIEDALREDGHATSVLRDGKRAREHAQRSAADLVIVVARACLRDATGLSRELRADGCYLPLLVLTLATEVAHRVEAFEAGADALMSAPFDTRELLARVRALGRRHNEETRLRVGALELDPATGRATVGTVDLGFTRREFELVLFLARARGRTFTREALLSAVWQIQFDPHSNVVAVHIRNVRQKLRDLAPMLETIRGVGYRLSTDGSLAPASKCAEPS